MPTEAVEPLRPSKNTPSTSPVKTMANSPGPLRELSPMERRRNSPSYNQLTKKPLGARETSPLDTSPFGASKHRFWQSRDPNSPSLQDSENSFDGTPTLSPKRNSIENLMKASRVRNSTMFARETKDHYDPTKLPVVERPLAAGRPLSAQGYVPRGFDPLRNRENLKTHHRGESEPKIATAASKIDGGYVTNIPPKPSTSPLRSSLSRNGRFSQGCDNDSSVLSSDDEYVGDGPARPLRRHAKSVTFEAKPPVINEYEMVTPEPSLASREGSYESGEEDEEEDYEFEGDSMDRDDSFDASLEDTDKTPVVLPEDWRHMSPEVANHELADTFEDPFTSKNSDAGGDGDHLESARERSHSSDGEQRPLPPLPQFQNSPPDTPRGRRESNDGIAAAAERVSNAHRTLPSPPRVAANFSKADILSIGRASMTLEDRLDLMGIKDSREGTPTKALEAAIDLGDKNDAKDNGEEQPEGNSALESFNIPPISREAIMEKVKSGDYDDYNYTEQPSMISERKYGDVSDLDHDPDVPIQSREVSSNFDVDVPDLPVTAVKLEDGESGFDINSIPEMHSPSSSPGRGSSCEGSVIHHDISGKYADSDDGSHYSSDDVEEKPSQQNSTDEDDGPPTPKADSVAATEGGELVPKSTHSKVDGLPDFGSFENVEDFHLQLQSFLGKSRSPPPADVAMDAAPKLEPDEDFLQRPITPPEQTDDDTLNTEDEDPGTPESVIRHPIQPDEREDSEVDEPAATIKAPGGTLKTRTSSTPSDFSTMAATRRQVSGERPPPIPEKHTGRLSLTAEIEEPSQLSHVSEERSSEMGYSEGSREEHGSDWETKSEGGEPKRRQSFKMKLDFPMGDIGEDLSFDLDREFDRVVETQKKGYLMRQNTKIVYASSRKFSDEAPSDNSANASTTSAAPATERGLLAPPGSRPTASTPRKSTRERSNTWTTEPWVGKTRRRSVRNPSTASIGDGRPKSAAGPMPPLPGQESAVNSGDMSMIDESDENMEKGRLFVKVVGVKDLDMPLPRNEKTWFQLTLDNGLHCVTTAWLDLARDAAIGQEFELVVLNDLEFQLTLQTKLEAPPKPKVAPPAAPAPKPSGHKKTNSAFGRLLQSPKKRKEAERKQQEEAERVAALKAQQEREAAKRVNTNPTAWDLLHDLVGPDGSFARAYVCLKNYERQSYGRQFEVDVPCFNEWAIEEDPSITSSVKSKRGGVVRRPPYKVGKLTLQLLYVPKPKNAKDEDMPKSMNSCIRELKEAEELKSRIYEGHLSQQGGDCPYWRRRFFRLAGNKLTAFHETTRQPRATINLAKAAKLIDDHSTLKQKEAGCRRKSGFAEEDEGYAFVEEGFRIRFRNGETIDFYADNAQDKEGWMKVLGETINSSPGSCKPWTELVFQKEKAERAAAKAAAAAQANGQASNHQSSEHNNIQQQARARPQSTFEPGQQQHAKVQQHSSPVRSPPATYNRTALVGASPDKRRPISELNPGPAAPSVAVQKGSGGSAAARYLGKMGERRRGNIKSMIF